MTKEQSKFLADVCEEAGIDYSVQSEYSGRGMFGATTHGIVVDSTMELLVATINYMKFLTEEKLEKAPSFTSFKTDNMGRQTILY